MDKKEISNLYETIGRLIKENRIRNKPLISQEKLGKMIDMSRTSIVNIEMGRHHIQVHTLYDIANSLKIPITELIPDKNFEIKKNIQYSPSISQDSIKKIEKSISKIDKREG